MTARPGLRNVSSAWNRPDTTARNRCGAPCLHSTPAKQSGDMSSADLHNLTLEPGVLREWAPEDRRLLLWLPTNSDGGVRRWERIATAPGVPARVDHGIASVHATAI